MQNKNYRMMTIEELKKEQEELLKIKDKLIINMIDVEIKNRLRIQYMPILKKHMMIKNVLIFIAMILYLISIFSSVGLTLNLIAIAMSLFGLYVGVIRNYRSFKKYVNENYEREKAKLYNAIIVTIKSDDPYFINNPYFIKYVEIEKNLKIIENQLNYLLHVANEVSTSTKSYNPYKDRYLDEEEEYENGLPNIRK